MKLESYQEIIEHLNEEKRIRHLLLGNGFSMAYDHDIFSYNALSKFLTESDDNLLKKLFSIIKTRNFELIMDQLEIFYKLADVFIVHKKFAEKIKNAGESLKSRLIDAISDLHPEHVFAVPPEKSNSCADFLKEYLDNNGHIFTTNYDLLLYWVLMANQDKLSNISDGFGRESMFDNTDYDPDAEPELGDLEWGNNKEAQRVHYLHGALHLFDKRIAVIKETYESGQYLLERIKERIEKKEYPIFVTAGNGEEKLEHITHNQYLDYCYKQLSSITGSLITFGFGFGKYDTHIIDAINKAARQNKEHRLWSIYIGIYSEKDEEYIESIKNKFKCKKVHLFDAKTVDIW